MRNLSACLALMAVTSVAEAEGELGPMLGGAVVASHSDAEVAGGNAELVFWVGPIGIAAEASRQWTVDDREGPQVGAVAGSLRLLAFSHVMPSLLDHRDLVELGIELHGVVERAWWWNVAPGEHEPVSYGGGFALRLRGASDDDRSNLLAESRLFVRVMRERESEMSYAARDTSPSVARDGVTVMVGLGAAFGGGRSAYVEKLRRRNALDSEWLVR
jgi:hypothetical protein